MSNINNDYDDNTCVLSQEDIEKRVEKMFSPLVAEEIMNEAFKNTGGGMIGGFKCGDLASTAKYLAIIAVTIAAGCQVGSLPAGASTFAAKFSQMWGFMRNFQSGMSFIDKTSKFISYYFSSKERRGKVPSYLTNFISILCQLETDNDWEKAKRSLQIEVIPTSLDVPVTIQAINDLIIENNTLLLTKIREMVVDRQLAVVEEGDRIIKDELERRQNAHVVNNDDNDDNDLEFHETETGGGSRKSKRRRGRKVRKTRILKKKRS
jgi:hypothetical protein